MSSLRYRPNVGAIIKRADGKILIGERSDVPGAWQFPQGGVKKSETALEALSRELQEEVSLEPAHYRVIESNGPYRYLFLRGRTKEGFDGQEQTYFLVELTAPDSNIDVGTEQPEFTRLRWIDPAEFRPDWVPGFKQDVYRQVFADFFGIHF
jgi:putative (di)nucleoside polyphosphate hydrolase